MLRFSRSAVGRVLAIAAIAAWPIALVSRPSAQTPTPTPRPFPGGSTSAPPPAKPPNTPAPTPTAAPPAPAAQSSAALGAPIYPGATPLDVIDAGQGQKLYLFGTNASYLEIVNYYKSVLKTGGRELFKAPPMQQFDTGKFDDSTMTYQPSVVVKDYTWNNQAGYLFVSGSKEERFKTIIQIVPPTIK
ncbi:MAG TPA: hypothetical protein VJN96_24355 [Vicinamibacterales bacterium]|nr:hypothetical protein [Vicinamibacterales bacterium]